MTLRLVCGVLWVQRVLQGQLSSETINSQRYISKILTPFQKCSLLCYNAERRGNPLPTFRYNLPVPIHSWTLNMGPIDCIETTERNCQYSLRSNPEKHFSHLLRCGSFKITYMTTSFNTSLITRELWIIYFVQWPTNAQLFHKLITPPTCFDTIMSSSDSLKSIPCQVTQVFQMQFLVIQFTIKMFHTGFMQVLIL